MVFNVVINVHFKENLLSFFLNERKNNNNIMLSTFFLF